MPENTQGTHGLCAASTWEKNEETQVKLPADCNALKSVWGKPEISRGNTRGNAQGTKTQRSPNSAETLGGTQQETYQGTHDETQRGKHGEVGRGGGGESLKENMHRKIIERGIACFKELGTYTVTC